jgi:hypothetical protein
MVWGNYIALIGATIFILLGLVLLVDFAHSWTETCLDNWENSDSNMWQWILISSTAGTYIGTIALTGVLYAYFSASGCTLNRFFISFNLALCVLVTVTSVLPAVQSHNPRSGLAQAGMVAAYCTYLITSAVGNHAHERCNPFRNGRGDAPGIGGTTVVLGAVFTFLAIAYSTTRAATNSRALVGRKKAAGAIQLGDEETGHAEMGFVTTQPGRTETPRYKALLAAVEAGYMFSFFLAKPRADSMTALSRLPRLTRSSGRTMTTRMALLARPATTRGPARDTMSVLLHPSPWLPSNSGTVLVVPRHFRPRRDVRRNAAHGLERRARGQGGPGQRVHRPQRDRDVDAGREQLGMHALVHVEPACAGGHARPVCSPSFFLVRGRMFTMDRFDDI